MIDTVVILAAGRGTRMKELSREQPKHVILVNQRPFLFYLLDNLAQAGFKKIIVVVGYHKEVMTAKLRQWTKLPIEIVEQDQWISPGHYGTLCPIKAVEHLLKDNNFVAVNGDNLYSVKDLKNFHLLIDRNAIAGFRHDHPENYGALVVGPDDLLLRVAEKQAQFVNHLINTGLYAFTPEIFQVARQVVLSPRGEYEITDAINILAQQGKFHVISLQDYWLDFTKPDDIKQMELFINQDKL